jgi:hypothetical protein
MDVKKWIRWSRVQRFCGIGLLIVGPFILALGKNDLKPKDHVIDAESNARWDAPQKRKGIIRDKGAWRVQRHLILFRRLKYNPTPHHPARIIKSILSLFA